MPTYSYRCRECDTAFDIQQAFTDDTLTVCPNCGGALRKLFTAVGVSFTGSGFYRNDSRAAAGAPAGGASSSSSGASTSEKSAAPSGSGASGASSAPSSTPASTGSAAPKAAPKAS